MEFVDGRRLPRWRISGARRTDSVLFAVVSLSAVLALAQCGTADGTLFNLTLYVSGSVNGAIEPVNAGLPTEYGGFARLATVLRQRFDVAAAEYGNNNTGILAVDAGAVVGVTAFTQFAPQRQLIEMVASFGFSTFGVTPTDLYAGMANFLDNYDSMPNAYTVCSNAVFNAQHSARMARVLLPYVVHSLPLNVTIGFLGFMESGSCGRAVGLCGPGPEQLAQFQDITDDVIAAAVGALTAGAGRRPDVVVAVLDFHVVLGTPLPGMLARNGVDIAVLADGLFQSPAEVSNSSFIPPPAVEVVDGASGRRVVLASSMTQGQTVAKVDFTIDRSGPQPVVHFARARHLFTSRCTGNMTYPNCALMAPDVNATVVAMSQEVSRRLDGTTVGVLHTAIPGGYNYCRFVECGAGNILTDAMRVLVPNCEIAMVNSGTIRAGFDAGNVTGRELVTAYPFPSPVASFSIRGNVLLDVIRNGLSRVTNLTQPLALAPYSGMGRYLQYSGLRIRYNPFNPVDKRLLSVEVEIGPGKYGVFSSPQVYKCCAPTYMLDGGDDYTMLQTYATNRVDSPFILSAFVRKYFELHPEGLSVSATGRLIIDNSTNTFQCSPPCVHGTCTDKFVCVCDSPNWYGADCGTPVPVDLCEKHRNDGELLVLAHATSKYAHGLGVVALFAVLFGVEVVVSMLLTRRFLRVLRAKSHRGNGMLASARATMSNYVRVALLFIQAVQIHAVVFNGDILTAGGVLHAATRGFSVMGATTFSSSYYWHFWVLMAVTIVWICYASLYVADGGASARTYAVGRVLLFPADRVLQTWVAIGFIPTLLNGLRAFHCYYLPDGSAYMATESVCDVACWNGRHWAYVGVAFPTVLIFYPLATISAALWQDLDRQLDVRFAPLFFLVDPVVRVISVVLRAYFARNPEIFLSIMAVTCAFMAAFVHKTAPCYVVWVNTPIALTYLSVSLTCIVILAAVLSSNNAVVIGAPVVWALAVIVSGLAVHRHSQTHPIFRRKETGATSTRTREMFMAMKNVFQARVSVFGSGTVFPAPERLSATGIGKVGLEASQLASALVAHATRSGDLPADALPWMESVLARGCIWPTAVLEAVDDETVFLKIVREIFEESLGARDRPLHAPTGERATSPAPSTSSQCHSPLDVRRSMVSRSPSHLRPLPTLAVASGDTADASFDLPQRVPDADGDSGAHDTVVTDL